MKNRVLLILVTFAVGLPSYAALTIRFEKNAVVASGLTRGATAMWMDVSLGSSGSRVRITDRSSTVADDDHDGVVRLAVEDGVRDVSVWAVVDMTSGEYTVDTPAPGHFPRHPLPAAALHRKGNGRSADIESDGTTTVLWCVRPGVGAWKAIVDDGEAGDADGAANGKTRAATQAMHAVEGNAEPPDDMKPGDVVFAVDLWALASFDARVGN